MAFSNLVLPNVAPVQQGGPLVNAMQGINSLINNMANTKTAQAQATYAPYNQYGTAALNIAQANMLPYTTQAQLYSNPMMFMAMEQLRQTDPGAYASYQQNMANFGKSLNNFMSNQGRSNALFGNMPFPGQNSSNGLGGLINNMFGRGSSSSPNAIIPSNNVPLPYGSNNAMAPNQPIVGGGGNTTAQPVVGTAPSVPVLPAIGGPAAAVGGKLSGEYREQPTTPGKTYTPDYQHVYSASTPEQTNASQQAILGIKNLKPILDDISTGAPKWLDTGEKGKIQLAQVMNGLQQQFGSLGGLPKWVMDKYGVTTQDISDYAEWQAQKTKAAETYMKARNWPQDETALKMVSSIIEPLPGEGGGYGQRVARDLAQLETQILPNYQQQLTSGPSLPTNGQPSQTAQPLASTPAAQNEGLAKVDLGSTGQAVVQDVKTLNGISYAKINGKWYQQ